LIKHVEDLEDQLMENEMLLQDALQDSTTKFKDKIKEFNGEISKKTQDFMQYVLEQCAIFHEGIKQHAMVEQAAFMAAFEENPDEFNDNEDEDFMAKLDVLGEKEAMMTHLDTYKEFMEN